ncbi:hypothetical protein [Bacillus mycoides]|uniref:hypothetical protein n=1 Tax=Bacillus mycoides TaxID=1405 RepID=UPI00273CEB1B|nr:hypothetical protein [Bacillus mycoides]
MKVQIYLGKPQTEKLPVYDVQPGQQVNVTQIIINNSLETDQKVIMTVNTIDILTMKAVPGDNVRVLDIVLNPGDKLLLKQETENAVNVMVNGNLATVPANY